ncbi:smg-9, nonsense mediated mRNA decay factor [Nowakowskiella sp. JEL0407]|nr:smg-9, nonsense mediated mRNA decay factor [Nowakowskiella sp. JEL0407]
MSQSVNSKQSNRTDPPKILLARGSSNSDINPTQKSRELFDYREKKDRERRIDDFDSKRSGGGGSGSSNGNSGRRRDRKKVKDPPGPQFTQTPVILERRQANPDAHGDGTEKPPATKQPVDVVKEYTTLLSNYFSTLDLEKLQTFSQKPVRPMQMMDLKQNISYDQIVKNLNDQPGCFIVGVLGRKSVGKTSLLLSLAQNSKISTLKVHDTRGIDMYITSERVILLDTPPIFDPAIVDRVKSQLVIDIGHNFKKLLELFAIQLTMYMYSICHILVVVCDDNDTELFNFLRKVESLKSKFTNPNSSPVTTTIPDSPNRSGSSLNNAKKQQETAVEEYFPEIVFVLNKLARRDFALNNYVNLSENISRMFSGSKLRASGRISIERYLPQLCGDNYINPYAGILSTPQNIPPPPPQFSPATINLFLLPKFTQSFIEENPLIPNPSQYEILAKHFRNAILETPRFNTPTVSRKWFQISEKDWFRSAVRIWEGIKRSNVIFDEVRKG